MSAETVDVFLQAASDSAALQRALEWFDVFAGVGRSAGPAKHDASRRVRRRQRVDASKSRRHPSRLCVLCDCRWTRSLTTRFDECAGVGLANGLQYVAKCAFFFPNLVVVGCRRMTYFSTITS